MTYNLEWRDVITQTTTVVTGITDLFHDLNGLTENTDYEFRVQEDDGVTTSAWSSWTPFSTTASTISITYNLEWRDVSTQTTTVVTGITDLFYDLNGLTENTDYEFRVQEDDGSVTSAWSVWSPFTTTASSNNGINGIVGDYSNEVTTPAIVYNLEWRDVDTQTTAVVTGITDLFYDLTGLTESTNYEFRVQEDYESVTSAWSVWSPFTTTSPSTGTTPTQFTLTDQTGVALSTVIESNAITVAGVDAATDIPISVTGGEYAVLRSGGSTYEAYTSVAGNVQLNDQVKVRNTSSASNNTSVNTTLEIGGTTDTFTITTLSDVSQVPQGTTTIGIISKGSNSASIPFSYSLSDATSFQHSVDGNNWETVASPIVRNNLTPNTPYSGQIRPANATGTGTVVSYAFTTTSESSNVGQTVSQAVRSKGGPERSGRPPRI